MKNKFIIIGLVIISVFGVLFLVKKYLDNNKKLSKSPMISKQECIKNFSLDEALKKFPSLSQEVQYSIASYIACEKTLKGDLSVCDKIPQSDARQQEFNIECKADFGTKLGIILSDVIMKKGFVKEDVQNCVSLIKFSASDADGAKNTCEEIFNAALNNNGSFCNQAKTERERAKCLNLISANPGVAACAKIEDGLSRNGCEYMANFLNIIRTGKGVQDCEILRSSIFLEFYNQCKIHFTASCEDQIQRASDSYCQTNL